MRLSPLYAPDGMAGAGGNSQRFRLDAVQAHERYDDGLVHNHNWAASSNDAAPVRTSAPAGTPGRFHDHVTMQQQDRYDDGLVHNHDWAVSGK